MNLTFPAKLSQAAKRLNKAALTLTHMAAKLSIFNPKPHGVEYVGTDKPLSNKNRLLSCTQTLLQILRDI